MTHTTQAVSNKVNRPPRFLQRMAQSRKVNVDKTPRGHWEWTDKNVEELEAKLNSKAKE